MNQLNQLLQTVPDTRPYPQVATKNELLRYAAQIADPASATQVQRAREQLDDAICAMLAQNQYLSLSVALSMTTSPTQYRVLWQTLCHALSAHDKSQIQWLAFPVVVVIGAAQAGQLDLTVPQEKLKSLLAQHPLWPQSTPATWLPHLIDSGTLAHINAGDWFAAKQNLAAADDFAKRMPAAALSYAAGQDVSVLYALCYGDTGLRAMAGKNPDTLAMPLMQLWQETLAAPRLTIFVNPLSGEVPAAAQCSGGTMRQRMECDVFTANAVRSIRLQHPRVAVVVTASEGGRLLFSFQAHEESHLPPLTFTWNLFPDEEIGSVVQNFLDLLAECRIEHVWVLQEILFAQEPMPSYQQALKRQGFNPFFVND